MLRDTAVSESPAPEIARGCAPSSWLRHLPARHGTPVTRYQMAVFLENAMRRTANWPPHTVLVFHHPAAEANSDVNSGTELLSLVAAIPSVGPEAPSASNPWLIKVGPGVYDLGSGSVTLPVYTSLEGAGQSTTVITAAGYSDKVHGTVILGDHSRLSRLTVNNSGSSIYGIGAYLPSMGSEVAFEHVTLTASSPSNGSGESYCLLTDPNTSFSMVDCNLTAHGPATNWGIYATTSSAESRLDGVRVTVFGSNASNTSAGFVGYAASPVIRDSRFDISDSANSVGIYVWGGGILDLRDSEIHNHGVGNGVEAAGVQVTLQNDIIISQLNAIFTSDDYPPGLSADINNCRVEGGTTWLHNEGPYTVTVGASKLVGATTNLFGGTASCFGNYTGSVFLANTCP